MRGRRRFPLPGGGGRFRLPVGLRRRRRRRRFRAWAWAPPPSGLLLPLLGARPGPAAGSRCPGAGAGAGAGAPGVPVPQDVVHHAERAEQVLAVRAPHPHHRRHPLLPPGQRGGPHRAGRRRERDARHPEAAALRLHGGRRRLRGAAAAEGSGGQRPGRLQPHGAALRGREGRDVRGDPAGVRGRPQRPGRQQGHAAALGRLQEHGRVRALAAGERGPGERPRLQRRHAAQLGGHEGQPGERQRPARLRGRGAGGQPEGADAHLAPGGPAGAGTGHGARGFLLRPPAPRHRTLRAAQERQHALGGDQGPAALPEAHPALLGPRHAADALALRRAPQPGRALPARGRGAAAPAHLPEGVRAAPQLGVRSSDLGTRGCWASSGEAPEGSVLLSLPRLLPASSCAAFSAGRGSSSLPLTDGEAVAAAGLTRSFFWCFFCVFFFVLWRAKRGFPGGISPLGRTRGSAGHGEARWATTRLEPAAPWGERPPHRAQHPGHPLGTRGSFVHPPYP